MSIAAWIEAGLAAARSAACVIIVEESTQANLRWANTSLTTNGQMHARTASVVAIAEVAGGQASGSVSGPVASAGDVVALVAEAESVAAASSPSDEAMPLPAGGQDDDFTAPAEGTSIEVFTEFARGLGRCFEDADRAGHLLFGFAEHEVSTIWLATSSGTRRRHVQPRGRVELNAKHQDMIRSAWAGQATADFTDVNIDALHAEAVRRLGWAENRLELPAGRYETILPPSALADLLIYLYWTMNARDAEEGRNVFAGEQQGTTRLGEQLAMLPITLTSDPAHPGLPAAPFAIVPSSHPGMVSVFDNGASVGRVDWLTDGKLTALVRTRASLSEDGAAQAALPFPTANLIADGGGTATLDEMVARTKRGLLLTCLWYIREVNPETLLLTGLTRDGVYLIEDGEIKGMVNNFRFNESPVDLLQRITEVSRSEPTLCREWNDDFTYTVMPAARVPDFNMSTVSRAH